MVITLKTQSLYRLGVKLTEKVNPNLLRVAVNVALERFPYFKVELKRGLFRHYLDENVRTPLIEEDDGVLLKILNFRHNRYYLFRVTYYGNRIFIDFFHGLCDANGGIEFLKTVVYYYYKNDGKEFPDDYVMTLSSSVKEGETEDAFRKYYRKIDVRKGIKSMAGGSAFSPPDRQFTYEGFGLVQGEVPTSELLAAAHAHDCTVTVYLAALALLAVQRCYGSKTQKYDFIAFIPVNLRRKYPSDTMFNFTNFARCRVGKGTPSSVDEFVAALKSELNSELTEEELQLKLSFSSLMDVLPLFRYMPLFIKGFLSRAGRSFSVKSKQTMIISNLGEVKLEDGEKVEHFLFNLNCAERTPVNLAVVSYNGRTLMSFTRKLIDPKIERRFFRLLNEECKGLKVAGNYREDSDVL